MAEDTQEDLSMEDILSSIKDILLEDSSEQQKNKKVSQPDAAASATISRQPAPSVEPDVLDDVLTLSPSMIVEPNLSVETSAEQPAGSAEEGADPLDLDFEQEFNSLPAEPVLDDVSVETPVSTVETVADEDNAPLDLSDFAVADKDDIDFKLPAAEDENILPDLDFAEVDTAVTLEAEPIFSPEDEVSKQKAFSASSDNDFPSLDTLIDDETLNAILDSQPEEPEVVAPEEVFVEPTDNVYENAAEGTLPEPEIKEAVFSEVEEEAVPSVAEKNIETHVLNEPDPIYVPEETEAFKISEPEAEVEKIISSPLETEAAEEEAVDISANIINNFAKMFAEQQKEKLVQSPKEKEHLAEQAMAEIELGDGNLTIEAIVRDVVTGIVEKNLSADFDFSATASAEIARQTKIWLSANLPAIVEATVKKEIERVMAKVSS